VLIGLATAAQVAPGIFAVHLLLTRQWRALGRAVAAWVAATGLAFVVLPGPSTRYYTSLLYQPGRVGNVAFFSNQSVWGMLARADLGSWHLPALVLAIGVVGVGGLGAAAAAHRRPEPGASWRAAVLVGLTWTLVSPVTWIHGMVWLVPAGVLVVGAVRRWWRAVVGVVLFVLLWGRVHGVDRATASLHLPSALIAAMVDVYGIVAALLLVVLAWPVARSWVHGRQVASLGPAPSAVAVASASSGVGSR
jgi:hypothetical protein